MEMRIDMKRDNLKMIRAMDQVNTSSTKVAEDLKQMRQNQNALETCVVFLEETKEEEIAHDNQVTQEMRELQDQLHILHGIVQKWAQDQTLERISKERDKQYEFCNNLIITGLDKDGEDKDETTTAEMVVDFFSQMMKIPMPVDIVNAKRIGKAKPRTVLIELRDANSKGVIFKHVKNLKDCRNNEDKKYFVNNQQTPEEQETQRHYRQLIKYNEGLTGVSKRTLEMKKGELLVDNYPFHQNIHPPSIDEIMYPLDPQHVGRMKLCKGNPQKKGNCTFVGYAVRINSIGDVRAAYTKVAQLNSSACHISCAYRLPGIDYINLRGYQDDGEHGAGRTIYYQLEEQNLFIIAVYVVRYYGNRHLGPVRFQLIKGACNTSIKQLKSRQDEMMVNQRQQQPSLNNWTTTKSKNAVSSTFKGYATTTSPRPFTSNAKSWGSQSSIASTIQDTDKDTEWNAGEDWSGQDSLHNIEQSNSDTEVILQGRPHTDSLGSCISRHSFSSNK